MSSAMLLQAFGFILLTTAPFIVLELIYYLKVTPDLDRIDELLSPNPRTGGKAPPVGRK